MKLQLLKLRFKLKSILEKIRNRWNEQPESIHDLKMKLFSIDDSIKFLDSYQPENRVKHILKLEEERNAIIRKIEKKLPVWAVEANLPK